MALPQYRIPPGVVLVRGCAHAMTPKPPQKLRQTPTPMPPGNSPLRRLDEMG